MTAKAAPKRIMGIDPGTNRMGYGIIEIENNKAKCLVMGDIELGKLHDAYEKLHRIFERISGLIAEYRPEEVALEAPFYGKNVQSMLKLGRAQGVAMAAALHAGLPVFEYAPRRIKQSITGIGSAAKEQVASMLGNMLKIDYDPKRLDATDGLAVALCHWFISTSPCEAVPVKRPTRSSGKSKSWEAFLAENPDREVKHNNRKQTH